MSRKKGLTLNKFRGGGYAFLKFLGDVQAATSKRPGAIKRRVATRIGGKITGRLLGELRKILK